MTILIANIIDFLAALIQVGSGSIKKKSKILAVQILQLMMQAVSMLLLGGVTGAVSNVLSCYRNYLCYKEKLNTAWKIVLKEAVTEVGADGAVVGKIDDGIGTAEPQFRKGLGNSVLSVDADQTGDPGFTQGSLDQLTHGAGGAADDGSHAMTPSFLISSSRTALVLSSMGVRGRRR